MRVVYMGTPAIAVAPMKAIKEAGHELLAVVSQPDRPKGRGKALAASEVKEAALGMGLSVLQPEKASEEGFFEQIRALSPDVAVVMAYGQKIPARMLALPKHGFINIHASILPEYRGAAPVQRAIMDGRDATGVTIMYMSEGMDEGDIGLVRRIPITPHDDAGAVLDKVSSAGAELIVEMLRLLDMGQAPRVPQVNDFASLARKITKKDESIDWGWTRKRVVDHVRALSPAPGARLQLFGNEIKVCKARSVDASEAAGLRLPDLNPGTALALDDCSVYVAAADGWVELESVRPAGGRTMECRAFSRGRRLSGNTRVE